MYYNHLICCKTANFFITDFLTAHSSHHNLDRWIEDVSIFMYYQHVYTYIYMLLIAPIDL